MNTVNVSTRVHIFVELNKDDKKKIEFDTDHVSGQQIKQRAGVPAEYDLARRHGQKLELVTNDQTVEIKDGDHFVALPPGTIS
ncbi:MAG: multiubiquitin domain-containing protein [Acidobacteriota bacterium]